MYEEMYSVYAKKFDRIAALTAMVERLEKAATPPNLIAAIWRYDAITEHFAHYLVNSLRDERERAAAEALCERLRRLSATWPTGEIRGEERFKLPSLTALPPVVRTLWDYVAAQI